MMEVSTKVVKPNEVVDLETVMPLYPTGSIDVKSGGNCIVLFLYTDEGGEVIIEAGDSVFAGAPLTFNVSPSTYYVVQLETGRFMWQSGENKGKIIITTDVEDLTCNCFQFN